MREPSAGIRKGSGWGWQTGLRRRVTAHQILDLKALAPRRSAAAGDSEASLRARKKLPAKRVVFVFERGYYVKQILGGNH